MKNVNFLLSFVFLLLIASCDPPLNELSTFMPDKQSLADDVRIKVAKQLKENELYLFGFGGRMMYEIQMLGLSFHYYKEIDIEQARALLILSANSLINEVNATTLIRPYLENSIFNYKNVEIVIYLIKSDHTRWEFDKLDIVSIRNGELEYKIRSSETKRLMIIYNETYEEAVEKLNNQAF